jgi:hypothetical protein
MVEQQHWLDVSQEDVRSNDIWSTIEQFDMFYQWLQNMRFLGVRAKFVVTSVL